MDYIVIRGTAVNRKGKRFAFEYRTHERDSEVSEPGMHALAAGFACYSNKLTMTSCERPAYPDSRPDDYSEVRFVLTPLPACPSQE